MQPKDAAAEKQALESIVERFEQAWQSGQPPRLEDFLTDTAVCRRTVLIELIHTDLEYRLKAGQPARVEEYLQRFPELASMKENLIELIVAEYSHCCNLGQTPTTQEYLQRFPSHRSELEKRLGSLGAGKIPDWKAPAILVNLPDRVGRYRIEKEIARGGMGLVARVQDEEFERPMAMKVLLRTDSRDLDLEERFLREARLTGQLQHPGVPPVQDMGRLSDGRPYFIMKLIEGDSLAGLLRKRHRGADTGLRGTPCADSTKLDAPDADSTHLAAPGADATARPATDANDPRPATDLPRFLTIFEQICQTVSYAHARGVLHRDLKPANIMVGEFGEVQVMDWGLAKQMARTQEQHRKVATSNVDDTVISPPESAAGRETVSGSVMGTLSYIAPEQARGEIDKVDQRSDVFGLGAILCEILTGRPAFTVKPWENAIAGDLSDAFTRLDQCGADAELVGLAKICLAPDKKDRPADAGSVATAVAKYQADVQQRLKEAEIQQARTQALLAEEAKRRRIRAALVLVGILLFVLASGAAVLYVRDRADRENRMLVALQDEQKQRKSLHDQLADPIRVHVLLSKIDDWKSIVNQRKQTLDHAQVLWATAQGPLAAHLGEQLDEQRILWESDNTDFQVAKELDDYRSEALAPVLSTASTTINRTINRTAAAVNKYGKAFARLQLDMERGDIDLNAKKIVASPIRHALVAAVDEWAVWTEDVQFRLRLLEIAKRADPDSRRDQIRDTCAKDDRKKLLTLAEKGSLADQSPQFVLGIAWRLAGGGNAIARKTAQKLVEEALVHHPDNFWLHLFLGDHLLESQEQIGCFRAALAIRPHNSHAHTRLGHALSFNNIEGAIACYQKVLEHNPKYTLARTSLAYALREMGDVDGTIACWKEARKFDPENPEVHIGLGGALLEHKLDVDEAINCFKEALKCDDTFTPALPGWFWALKTKRDVKGAITLFEKFHKADPYYVAEILKEYGDTEEAIRWYQKAIDIAPDHVAANAELGAALEAKGELERAVICYEKVLKYNPYFTANTLGSTLLAQGKFTEAKQATLQILKLLSQENPLRKIFQDQLKLCDQKLDLEQTLFAVLQKQVKPKDTAEQIALAELCLQYKKLPAAAIQFYEAAFTDQPPLAKEHRYNAACAAALAAAGQGKGTTQPEPDKAKLRQQALTWIKEELAALGEQLKDYPRPTAKVAGRLKHWQSDPDLVSVRDNKELAMLPAEERQAWEQFWGDVAQLLKKTKAAK